MDAEVNTYLIPSLVEKLVSGLVKMQRERVADNVYYFQSDVYAQVTAGAVIGPNWAVVIDTLAIPDETLQIRDFIEQELNLPVQICGGYALSCRPCLGKLLFSRVLRSSPTRLSRKQLAVKGQQSLVEARKQNPAFRRVKIVLASAHF